MKFRMIQFRIRKPSLQSSRPDELFHVKQIPNQAFLKSPMRILKPPDKHPSVWVKRRLQNPVIKNLLHKTRIILYIPITGLRILWADPVPFVWAEIPVVLELFVGVVF